MKTVSSSPRFTESMLETPNIFSKYANINSLALNWQLFVGVLPDTSKTDLKDVHETLKVCN